MILFYLGILLVVVVALLSGFIVNPVWYVWLGVVLWGASSARKLQQM